MVTTLPALVDATVTLPKLSGSGPTITGFVPMPERVTVFGDSDVLLAITSVPGRGPPTVGVITTATTHAAPADNVDPQVVPLACIAKSPVAATLCLLVTVTNCAVLGRLTSTEPKSMVDGVTVIGFVPTPDSVTVFGDS